MRLLPSDTILNDRYIIRQHIDAGGMGAVYLAYDGRLGVDVALKQITITGEEYVQAFLDEAHLLARLKHPHLPKVIDCFTDEHGQFLVMEFIPGDNLAKQAQARSQSFPVDQVLQWADQLLDVLEYLAEHRVVHRDIKPANLKCDPKGTIFLLDFGLAKGSFRNDSPITHVRTTSVHGYTVGYAALEQEEQSGKRTEARSDLYGLCTTLYYLLTLDQPKSAVTRTVETRNGYPDPVLPAHELNPLVPPRVSEVLAQGMALGIDERPASATILRTMLHQAIAPVPSEPPQQPQRRSRASLWRQVLLWLLLSTCMLLIVVSITLTALNRGVSRFLWPPTGTQTADNTRDTTTTATSLTSIAQATQTSQAQALTAVATSATAQAQATLVRQTDAARTATAQATTRPTTTPTVTQAPPTSTPTTTQAPTNTVPPAPTTPKPVEVAERPQPTATRRPAPTATRQPVPTATRQPEPTATLAPAPPPVPILDGTWQGSTSTGGTITFTVAERRIRSIYFEYASDVGPTQEGDCALVAPCPGYSSVINGLRIAINQAGTFESSRIPVQHGSNVRYLNISGSLNPAGSASGQLKEDRPDDYTPACTHRSFFDWTTTKQ